MSSRVRATLIVGLVAAATFNVVTFFVNGWPGELNGWPGPGPPRPLIYVIVPTVVLVSYLLVGLVAWQRHPEDRVGPLFMVVGFAYLLPSMANLHTPLPYTIGNVVKSLWGACLVYLALAWPYGRLRSRLDRAVVIGDFVWSIGSTAFGMLFWNPRTNGCGAACPSNLLLVHGSVSQNQMVDRVTDLISTAIVVVVVGIVVQHWWATGGYARRSMTRFLLVLLPIAAYGVLLQEASTFNLDVSDLLLNGIGPLVLLAAPAAYAAGMFRTRRARSAVGAALVDLEPGPAPGRLRVALAKALGDPSLQLAFRAPGQTGYVDTSNRPVDIISLPRNRMVMGLDPTQTTVLIHDEAFGHEPELLKVTAAAASLALEHARLQAEIETQLDQVRASRTRLVEAGDEARRRLERDLHDGVQQRLVTLTLALAMARDRAAGIDPELESLLESATKEAREALVELRDLARGIHPAVLTEAGLSGAIQALVERSAVPTTITAVPAERFSAPVEATAYFVISEALANVAKHAPTATAQVAVRRLADQIVVEVTDGGGGGARPEAGSGLRGLADRVASVGGSLHVESPVGRGTRLRAEIPCP